MDVEAEQRLENIPDFIRPMARKEVERVAKERGDGDDHGSSDGRGQRQVYEVHVNDKANISNDGVKARPATLDGPFSYATRLFTAGHEVGISPKSLVRCVFLVLLVLSALPLWAQHDAHGQPFGTRRGQPRPRTSCWLQVIEAGWEGSVAGIAYSEFNHHFTGHVGAAVSGSRIAPCVAVPFMPGPVFFAGSLVLTRSFSPCLE